MLKGKYIGPDNLLLLKREEEYYLFPNGGSHFYVSRFPNEGAHMGCFEQTLFQIEKTSSELSIKPKRIPISLDTTKIYLAKLVWRPEGYKSTPLKVFFIKPQKAHGYLYDDPALTKCRGSFPLHWFEDFRVVTEDIYIIEETNQNKNDSNLVLSHIEPEKASTMKVNETESESDLTFEQLSLFD